MRDNGEVTGGVGGAKAPPKRVAIVGLGPSSLSYVQKMSSAGKRTFDEVWTVNSYADVIKSDRLFHMDDFLVQEKRAEKNPRIAQMLEAIKEYQGPVITCRPLSRYPTSVAFPLERVISEFGCCYFNNTVPYMLAYAGLIGVEEIYLFGCDYSWPDKNSAEKGRACVEYWMGQLNARGIATMVARESTLMDAREYRDNIFPIYGYCDGHVVSIVPVEGNKLRMTIMEKKELPSAEEMEEKYDHGVDMVPAEIDVVGLGVVG